MKFKFFVITTLIVLVIVLPMFSACGNSPTLSPVPPTMPPVVVNDVDNEVKDLETQVVPVNNCGGKADVTHIVGRGRTYEHTIQWDVGGEFEVAGKYGVVDLAARVSAHYGQSSTEAQSEVAELELIAPQSTNMEVTVQGV